MKFIVSKVNKIDNAYQQTGSSMVELIVSLVVFIPLFIGIPLLGKYADIKHKTIESSRYVAWERTIYSDVTAGTSWKDANEYDAVGENSKSDAEILYDAEKLFFGHPQQAVHDDEITENVFWRNRKGESLLALAETEDDQPANTLQLISGGVAESAAIDGDNNGLAQFTGGAVKAIATGAEGFGPFSSSDSSSVDDLQQQTQEDSGIIGNLMGGGSLFGGVQCGFPGINLNEGIGLGSNNYAEVQVSTPVLNFLKMNDDDEDLTFKANAAILSNAWTAPSDEEIYERLDNVVPNQFLGCITLPGRYTFGLLGRTGGPLFGEGKYSHEVQMAATSTLLPNGLTYYDENRQ